MDASDAVTLAVCVGLDEPTIWRMEIETRDQFVERVFDLHRCAVGEDAMSDAALEAAIDALRDGGDTNCAFAENPTIPTQTETVK